MMIRQDFVKGHGFVNYSTRLWTCPTIRLSYVILLVNYETVSRKTLSLLHIVAVDMGSREFRGGLGSASQFFIIFLFIILVEQSSCS